MSYAFRSLLGRLTSGKELGRGSLVHAVDGWTALCGKKPGPRSAGWSSEYTHEAVAVSCEKCRKRLEKKQAEK